jgi:hypothetical protein
MSFKHPAGKLHARLKALDLPSRQMTRDFVCWLLKRPPVESLTKLEAAEVEHLNGYFETRSDAALAVKAKDFLQQLFREQEPSADPSFFEDWLELQHEGVLG